MNTASLEYQTDKQKPLVSSISASTAMLSAFWCFWVSFFNTTACLKKETSIPGLHNPVKTLLWKKKKKSRGEEDMGEERSRQRRFSSVQSLSHVRLFESPWIAAHQASLSITNSQSLLKLMSIKSVCHPAISSSVVPFSSCPQSLPASGCFPMSQLFTWGGQSIGVSASASVLPMNTQDLKDLL